jgi:hypothetical protein
MKRFISYLFVMALSLVLTKSVDAADKLKAPKAGLSTVEVDGQLIGTLKLNQNGLTKLPKLKSGLNVSLRLKNGLATSAQVTDGRGQTLPATVQNKVAERIIIIIIRIGGGTIVVVVRQ